MKYIKVGLLAFFMMVGCEQTETVGHGQKGAGDEIDTPVSIGEEHEAIEEPSLIVDDEVEQVDITEKESEVKYKINRDNWKVEPLEGGIEQVVLLTIDDAPNDFSIEMAETLQEIDAPAIFFVNGHFIADEAGEDKLRTLHEMGFEIGNHTMNHPNMGDISMEEQRREIVELNDLIEEIIGERPRFYRAPFGVNTETSEAVMIEEDMTSMNWTYGYDWEANYQNAEALADIMVNTPYLTAGANLLMHDRQWTLGALTDIVTGLREKGYEIVDPKEIKTK
ncbi:peptidoglycan/xylan/chitin deacetylase (PgdA/CDA1 family) [Halalkalibacter nanhaiisediminis]|uniref:Peptidoglycan/xylan/chitin deacetylase (PgdA/CDA1 family) n=1 Tax=Halalkalibacter nanhaiisediminis TaxID=688079 RepID=A0A562QI25_9BACI|nr:peptidoglycan/xylan/chitin deacetylase (PgdA/CDA1 family) [Halalkalibacter nanhaiisediminis]